MATPAHDKLLAQCRQPDGPTVIEVDACSVEDANRLVSSLAALRIQARVIDATHLTGKVDLLCELAKAFSFPSYFGHNWDALLDCWSDFSWLPAHGWVCILLGSDALRSADAPAHQMLLSTCHDVAERWRKHGDKLVFKLVCVAAAK